MKRFITVSLALFLGLITAQQVAEPVFLQQAPPPDASKTPTDGSTPSTSDKFVAKFEDINEDLQRLNCILYDDLTFFDIRALEKYNPYTSDDAVNNILVTPKDDFSYNINFCKRFILNGTDGKEFKTFAYSTNKKEARKTLTDSGKPSYTETVLKSSKKDSEDDTTHIKFVQDGG